LAASLLVVGRLGIGRGGRYNLAIIACEPVFELADKVVGYMFEGGSVDFELILDVVYLL
jgi:hypothetical protein